MAAVKKLDVKDHWRHELSKLRCWLEGYKAGRHIPGSIGIHIPGEMTITQIILAIDDAKVKNGKDRIKAEVSLPIELPIEQAEEVVVQVLKDDFDRLTNSIVALEMKPSLENYQQEDLRRDVEVRNAVRTLLSYYMVHTDFEMFMRNR